MRQLIDSLYSGHKHHDLYLGVIETVEGIASKYPEDTWRRKAIGDAQLDEEIQATVYDAGLVGLGIDEKHGGMGGGLTGQVLATDLLTQNGLMSFAAVLTGFCREPLLNFGTEQQIQKYALPSISGDKHFCILATEPRAGTNTFNISTKAEKHGDQWVLNGQKTYITEAAKADYGFLIAKTGIETAGALSVFVVDMKSPGVTMQPLNISVSGNERQYSVFFDDVKMPADALVGQEGAGGKYMFAGLNAERLMIAAIGVGTADLALRETVRYVTERTVFGDTKTGAYQAVQHPLAQAKADNEAARLLMYHGAKLYDERKDAGMYANMAKLQASRSATTMADAAIQFHGGNGMDEDTGMLALWRTARSLKIAPINNEMVLNYIAQHCIGLPRSY